MVTLDDKSLITRTEHEIYLDYERQRRTQLLRLITPAFAATCVIVALVIGAALVVAPIPASARPGLLALRARRLNLATAFVAGTSALGTAGSVAIWGSTSGSTRSPGSS